DSSLCPKGVMTRRRRSALRAGSSGQRHNRSTSEEETMTDIADRLTRVERDQTHPNLKPRDAATLIIVDRSGAQPKVLLGKRHPDLKFMAGKLVFPGGRLEPGEKNMPVVSGLDPFAEARLMQRVTRPTADKARGLALAAIRETFE